MYEPFFGMERRPFSATPDPGCFFSSSELQTVLEELTVCVERGQGIGILTAAAGIGKTLLCQHLAASLRQRDEAKPQFECVYLANSNFPTRRSLLQAILFEMGDEYSRRDEPELRIDLRSRLLSLRPQREALVLIVDEAHLFADELLEELRTLSDLADDGSSLVRIVLSGQHELEERLTDRAFDALNQRISKHVYAESFTHSESVDYIQHRLDWSGCDIESVFSEEALGVIARASGGVPRCLNQLCDHSLLLAFASDQKPVSESTVREALEDLKQLPLHWNDVSDGTEVVGYVDDEEDEMFEAQAAAADESIDPEIEAALSHLASVSERASVSELAVDSATESPSGDAAESSASDEADDFGDEFGIVESLRGATSESSTPSHAPPLDGGFEFDFSSTAEDTAEAEQVIDADFSVSSQGSLESSEFGSANDEPAISADAGESKSNQAEFDEADVTLVQVLPSTPQETMLETRSKSGTHADSSEDKGISFKITSNGFEMDDFGPPEELEFHASASSADDERPASTEASGHDSDNQDSLVELPTEESVASEETVDSGVIEFSFSDAQSSGETEASDSSKTEDSTDESATAEAAESESVDQVEPESSEAKAGERAVSAAEITLALFGQDSVLPEHKSDSVLSASAEVSETAESESDEPQDAAETELAADIEQPSSADAPTAEEVTTEETASDETAAEVENFHDEESVMMSQVVSNEIGYEEELVYDPYAALQEPDGAGIVWKVVSPPKQANVQNVAEPTGRDDASAEIPEADSVESDEICETVDLAETAEIGEEQLLEAETLDETIASPDQIVEPSNEDTEATLEDEVATDDEDVATFAEEPDLVSQHSEEDPAGEEPADQSLELVQFDEGDAASEDEAEDCHDEIESVDDETSTVHTRFDESSSGEHDIVQPVEVRPLQPNRLVNAVLPLLDELDEDLDSVTRKAFAGRSVLDIEAELIQTIEHDSDELEDQIGATMLDICLDTQSALQDSAAAIRNAEAAGLENVNDGVDATDELSSEPFDIVQPAHPQADEESGYKLDLRFQELGETKPEADPSQERSANEGAADKPFGRLFSDLRRRKQ